MIQDHPDIRAALCGGYPRPYRQKLCPRCGYDLGDRSYEVEGEAICGQCFTDWVTDYLSTNPEELAEALYIPVRYEG